MKTARLLSASVLSFFLLGISFAQDKPITPAPKSELRVALMDTLRAPVQKALKIKVIFEVKHLKVQNGWAMMSGTPRNSDGTAIDYKKIKYAGWDAEAFDDWICALMKQDPKTKKWKVVTWVLGATDVAWWGWWDEYKAPRGIFPKTDAAG